MIVQSSFVVEVVRFDVDPKTYSIIGENHSAEMSESCMRGVGKVTGSEQSTNGHYEIGGTMAMSLAKQMNQHDKTPTGELRCTARLRNSLGPCLGRCET